MNKCKIIIVGGGIMQLPLIKQAKKMGLEVYVVDRSPQSPGMNYADIPVIADISDEENVLHAVKKVVSDHGKVDKGGVDGVVTVGTDFTRTVSCLGDYYRVPVLSYRHTQILTDKSLMREKLKSAGLPQPDFKIVENEEEFLSVLSYFSEKNQPVVVKPADSMGARGVKKLSFHRDKKKGILHPQSRFLPDFHKAISYSRKKKVIVEELILGKEYSMDAIAHSGEIQVTGIADRIIEFPPYFVETGHVIPSQADSQTIQKLTEGFIKSIRAVTDGEAVNGAFKGDIFVNENQEVVIGEIAGRLSGGYMSGYTYPLSSGINLMEAVIAVSLGNNPFPLEENALGVVIEKAVINKPGKVVEIRGEQEVRSCPGVEEVFIHVQEGDEVFSPENNLMKSANVIVRGNDYPQTDSYLAQALQTLEIIVA